MAPRVPSRIWSLLLTVGTCLMTHPFIGCFPCLLATPLLVLLVLISHINYMHLYLSLLVCFWRK